MSEQGIVYPDSLSYAESAKNLYVFHRGHNYRPIIMAIINGFPYLFGFDDKAVYVFSFYTNLLCWLTFFIVLFEIMKQYTTLKKSFLFTVLSIFFLGNSAFVFHLLTENIFMLFMIFGFHFLNQYYKNHKYIDLSVALGLFILSMLIRPGSMFLAVIFILYFSKDILKNYKSKAGWFIYGSIMLVLVQCAGLKHQFGNFTISYIDAVTYYNYLGSKAIYINEGKGFDQMNNPRNEYIFTFEAKEQKKIATEDFKNQLKNNTVNLIKAYFLNLMENSISGNICVDDCKNVADTSYFGFIKNLFFAVSKWQNILFTLVGFLIALYFLIKRNTDNQTFRLVAFFILYTILLSGISSGQGDRFHVITFPFVLLLIAHLFSEKKYSGRIFKPFFVLLQR